MANLRSDEEEPEGYSVRQRVEKIALATRSIEDAPRGATPPPSARHCPLTFSDEELIHRTNRMSRLPLVIAVPIYLHRVTEVIMSSRGIDFANQWVGQNVNVEAYDPPQSFIDEAVQQLVSDAESKGISREEIEEDVGDLTDFLSEAYEKRTDEEVERLAAKDD
jgi:hypothetical protein